MLALDGLAYNFPIPILLDSGAEVSLAGSRFVSELKKHNIGYSLREPAISVVGAHSEVELRVMGELDVPITLKDREGRRVGTLVTFLVTDSYDGGLLLSWDLLIQWEINIQGRSSGTTVSFERWPGLVFSDQPVPGSAWTEALRVQTRIVHEEKENRVPSVDFY